MGNKYFVIEGNTRTTYCFKNNIERINVVFVEGVSEPLPSSGCYKASEMLISDKEIQGKERYPNFNYNLFRNIEKASRDPRNCLL